MTVARRVERGIVTWSHQTYQQWKHRAEERLVSLYEQATDPDQYYEFLVTTARRLAHCVVVGCVALAMIISRLTSAPVPVEATEVEDILDAPSPRLLRDAAILRPSTVETRVASLASTDDFPLVRNFVWHQEERSLARTSIVTYTVREGDNVASIAQRFNLQTSSIIWANKELEEDPNILLVGQVLNILPVDGVLYEVQPSDTLSGIAERFKVKMEDIIKYPLNNLADGSNLVPGQRIIIPGGVKPTPLRVVGVNQPRRVTPGTRYVGPAPSFMASGAFIWPTRGYLSQGYHAQHLGIDIANGVGTPIAAADGGYVTFAGWSPVGYGYMVTLDHGNGFTTLYAHLSQWYVNPGQSVAPGQVIGAMGSTGRSTGPHLHFEIRYNGVPMNPLIYLR